MNWKDKIILLSGGGGFIGRNIAGILNERGAKVAIIPRPLLTSLQGLEEIIKDIKPEYIFHLASYGNHYHQKDNIDEIFATNVIKTYNLLRASANIDYKAFINVSTSSVYGTKDKPMKEDMLCEPETLYAYTKYSAEQLALMYSRVLDKPIVNVRPFSIYGPGEAEGRFIPNVVRSMVTGQSLDLVEQPVHDWIYIEDFINGMLAICENVDNFKGESVNIGTGKQYSNAEVVDMLLINNEKTVFPIYITESMRDYDQTKWVADISKIKGVWKPKFSLEEGLKETYNYYKEIYSEDFDPVEKSLKDFGIEFKKPEEMINDIK